MLGCVKLLHSFHFYLFNQTFVLFRCSFQHDIVGQDTFSQIEMILLSKGTSITSLRKVLLLDKAKASRNLPIECQSENYVIFIQVDYTCFLLCCALLMLLSDDRPESVCRHSAVVPSSLSRPRRDSPLFLTNSRALLLNQSILFR